VLTLQAINLSILLFAKRERALLLSSQYMLKLFELGDQPEAKTAHLVLLALKGDPKTTKSAPVLPGHSASTGKCLAQIQLQVRLYTQSILQIKFSAPSWKRRSSENLKIRCSCWQSYDLPSQFKLRPV